MSVERAENHQRNADGRWVPAIPGPLEGALKKQCMCGHRFWTRAGYRGHYALVHILRLPVR